MTETYLAVVGNRSGDAECLQTFADSLCRVGCVYATLLDSDSRAYDVSPLRILEADRLRLLAHLVGIETFLLANRFRILNTVDTILCKHGIDFIYAALVTFK